MTDEDGEERAAAPRPSGRVEPVLALDASGLRVLAHPVRSRLVGLLRRHGPATATQLAERLGLNSGATSYHLRQLASAGLIEDDPTRGNARERWWRSVYRAQSLNDRELIGSEPEATARYLQTIATGYASLTQQALNEFETMPTPWREVLDLSDCPLLLTPAEAGDLRRELTALLRRYRQDTPEGVAAAPAGAERVALLTQLLPQPGELAATEPVAAEAGQP
ncbi:helix-turn-helix domain-containing protein [Streptacidiphilus sp. P02-A3a]|nr:helix-turn-helix domain-containing protein [Streptacidiphilus sp. P02-A3a]